MGGSAPAASSMSLPFGVFTSQFGTVGPTTGPLEAALAPFPPEQAIPSRGFPVNSRARRRTWFPVAAVLSPCPLEAWISREKVWAWRS